MASSSVLRLVHLLEGYNLDQIAWSPDGSLLAIPSKRWSVQIWGEEDWTLRATLKGNLKRIDSLAWSPDGKLLATGSGDYRVRLWNIGKEKMERELGSESGRIYSLAWSPDSKTLVSTASGGNIRVWDIATGRPERRLRAHSAPVFSLSWSPTGSVLASGSADHIVVLWEMDGGGSMRARLQGHAEAVTSVTWSPRGDLLASGSVDRTIRIWNPNTGRQTEILEGNTDSITCVAFSNDGGILASKSLDNTVRFWRTDTWELVLTFDESILAQRTRLAFHPTRSRLATIAKGNQQVRIWDIEREKLFATGSIETSVHYTNAKVVLVGDTGVGKSGLSLALTNKPFVPTESTHGRRVWVFDQDQIPLQGGRMETRETLLWDLAGQPGYRLVHQLHLSEVTVALVLFDARSEVDSFSGIRHWDRALRQAQRVRGENALPMRKFLVAARTDRGGVGVSRARVEALLRGMQFDAYFETSAKNGWGVSDLMRAIREAINWSALPRVSSTDLFHRIKGYLAQEKESGRLLATVDDLFNAFATSSALSIGNEGDELRSQFETCIRLVESRDLIRRLSFGNLVLLQPELLDSYASSIVMAAKSEPDGLGCISEEEVQTGRFPMSQDDRIRDPGQERLLLIATSEDLLRHEIALRESTPESRHLVFPSQLTRENPDLPDPEDKVVVFRFEGPVLNIYATLVVRLAHSHVFKKEEFWQNAAVFTAKEGGTYGISLREIEEGLGELTLFLESTQKDKFLQFEEYIESHLERRAIPGSIKRRKLFRCDSCRTPLTEIAVSRRRERGFNFMECNVCGEYVSLVELDRSSSLVGSSIIPQMDRAADAQRDRDTAASILQGKIATKAYDVFLCYNRGDQVDVRVIGEQLKERGFLPWFDEWELRPGFPWQQGLEKQIRKIKAAAVFIGRKGIAPWQDLEQAAFLREFVKRRCPVIPVILPGAPKSPKLPVFLKGMTWVDFRKQDPDPLRYLIWGITGERVRE